MKRSAKALLVAFGALALIALGGMGVASAGTDGSHSKGGVDYGGGFTPIHEVCLWKLDPSATKVNPFAKPQTLVKCSLDDIAIPSTCGTGYQKDHYTITSADLKVQFDALVQAGVLSGPSGDAKFNPSNWLVQVNAVCVTTSASTTAATTPAVSSSASTTTPTTPTTSASTIIGQAVSTNEPTLPFTGVSHPVQLAVLGVLVIGAGILFVLGAMWYSRRPNGAHA